MAPELEDALDALDARRLKQLRDAIDRRLAACALNPEHVGAIPVAIRWRLAGSESKGRIMLCPACLDRHRLGERGVPDGLAPL